jgi:glucan 1,3-beta-glucosidase
MCIYDETKPWITPSIFQNTNNDAIIDEYTFGQMQNYTVALNNLQNHWQTWITESDFAAMSAARLNHVRYVTSPLFPMSFFLNTYCRLDLCSIPLGYWSVPLTSADTNYTTSVAPYIPGAWPYLLRALSWAKKYSLHVILDLHGAPGSQNGYDNSGQRTGNPAWAWNAANVSRTLDVLRFIAVNIGGMVDVIELLNEPAGFLGNDFVAVLTQFWQDGYQLIRKEVGGRPVIMIGDGFLGVDVRLVSNECDVIANLFIQSWQNFLTYPNAQGVLMDYVSLGAPSNHPHNPTSHSARIPNI